VPEQPMIVFDVNETLLNLDAIRPTFDRIFHDPAAMRLWFASLITYSEALTLAGVYVPFTDIGGAVHRMLAATRGITISAADGAELTAGSPPCRPIPKSPGRCGGSVTMASGCSRSPITRWPSTGASWSTVA
jgi:2-haloacid dehalogenase